MKGNYLRPKADTKEFTAKLKLVFHDTSYANENLVKKTIYPDYKS